MSRSPIDSATRWAICCPRSDSTVARPAPVEDAGRVVDLTVPEQVDRGSHCVGTSEESLGQEGSGTAAAARAAAGSAVTMRSRASSSWAADRNHTSKALGGQVHALVEHRVEERRVAVACAGARRPRSRGPRPPSSVKKTREHAAVALHGVRDAGGGERLAGRLAHDARGPVEVRVDVVGGEPQGGEAGGRGDRVPRQRAGLVDGALGREVRHHVGPAAERRGREAAAHHLAEGHQVGAPALDGAVDAPAARTG